MTKKTVQEQIAEGKTEGVVAEFPVDKVISMEDAMKLIDVEAGKKGYKRQTSKQRKEEEKQRQEMNRNITKGEFISQMQGFAENIDMGLQQYHTNHVEPLHNSFRAVNNLAEVLVEALIRKGVIDVEFLKELQEEMIQDALAKQEEANTEATKTTEQTTTEEEENNGDSDNENRGEIQR